MITGAGLFAFVVLSFVAAYVQTLTGFAFGLLLMGAVALTGLIPFLDAAIVTSLLTLVNAMVVLARGWRDIAARPFLMSLSSALPMIVVGYALLELLASTSLSVLRLTLGAVIIVSSLQLIQRPAPLARQSRGANFAFFGALAGLMGGLFSTAGPPLVFQFYRQPLSHVVIRETLVAIFAVNSLFRLGLVAASGDWQHDALIWTLAGVPSVVVASYLARRWPPPLAQKTLRRLAFVLLLLSGLSLMAPALDFGA
ncbi:sulfite exporter TauE/SafE family protein [Rhizobium sp. TRM96647]|uniref:sulfite exporter TauE/SafE family protein n=1 Tax=unclassified Rhizobium TaxID=2613769 RepID=UPI0021E96922|nr:MULTISPECIES: sulfite exporter TauE/SafE family protein [unclassified Rhizobium]MCV3739232.1 sulfite exporter TauE/SafE family protein [Rhizobium sp. TRM96647]MCV3760890.1 sulfite exporter TauE/SafE family protein [Rhizobium sp. TRM96650]